MPEPVRGGADGAGRSTGPSPSPHPDLVQQRQRHRPHERNTRSSTAPSARDPQREGDGAHVPGPGAHRHRHHAGTSRPRGSTPTTRSCGSAVTPASPTGRTAPSPSSSSDVEFPVSWSLNATNIVAQKYFRGTLGTPERESSLRQVIDRVADTITRWGVAGGYFVDDAEAEPFQRRAEAPPRHPEGRVQLAGLVQHRRQRRAPAGQRLLHPVGRRHDGLHPQLVPGGGHRSSRAARARASTCPRSAPASSC